MVKVEPKLHSLGDGDGVESTFVVEDEGTGICFTELGQLLYFSDRKLSGIGNAFSKAVRGYP